MSAADAAPPPSRGRGVLVEFPQDELIAKWEEFFEEMGYLSKIISVADRYPEERTLGVAFDEMNRFDTDMAIYLLRHPLNVLAAGEEAIRRLVPPGEELALIHLRIKALPRDRRVPIRDLRAKHLGQYIAVEGLVRKSTEVRPRVTDALFQCLRCGTVLKEPQDGQNFREPLECYEEQGGCKRSASATKFKLLTETSVYLDTQKLEIQEAPEGLRGGEEPQRLTLYVEDDLTGRITPGQRVIFNGILRSVQKGRPGARSTLFDIFMDANSMEQEQVEFEEIEVTEEDARLIREAGADPDIFRLMVNSVAPSIYGLHVEKEALALQIFSGVPKVMPDGRRIRGDIHILLVGDPGCLVGDERIVLGNGTVAKLQDLGRNHMDCIRTQVRLGAGGYRNGWATRFHRYANRPILQVVTESGKCIQGTYNHPLLAWNPKTRKGEWRRLDELRVGDRLRTARSIKCWKRALVPTGWHEPRYFHRSWHVRVPQFVTEDLAAIMGYILGDGWSRERSLGYTVADGERDLSPRLAGLFRRAFGVVPLREAYRNSVTYYAVNRTPIARWLSSLQRRRIPETIFASRDSVVASFLRWLFEADGSCFSGGRGKTAVTLRSVNVELLRDVQTILLRWGIHSSILWGPAPRPHLLRGAIVHGGPSGSLVIRRTDSILRFSKAIGFVSSKKRARLRGVVKRVSSRMRRRHGQNSERITSIRRAGRATVYDIEVPGPKRFIANGIISHNTAKSELLSYMSRLSPRGIYATGRAASGAGLTAVATRDEFGEGRWTLEAGALVLADRGLACLDELDKMNPQDRSSIHEALEQQRISVAKAGITAVLQARCSVLAAANPKFGRFDEHKYISEQIDLPPTLLSRFDIIFSLIDRPEAERDRQLAEHVLRGHRVGEIAKRREEGSSAPETRELEEPYMPHFTPDFLRKYVAYAKRIYPVMTEEAMAIIEKKYLDIRKTGEAAGSSVPITPRQLEAIIRLSEAGARLRLSEAVTADDAERAVRIVEYWMGKVAGEEGRFDIDIIQTGISQSQREQIISIRDIISELAGPEGVADYEDIVRLAQERDIPPAKVDAWLKRWAQEGEIYSPAKNKYKLVERL